MHLHDDSTRIIYDAQLLVNQNLAIMVFYMRFRYNISIIIGIHRIIRKGGPPSFLLAIYPFSPSSIHLFISLNFTFGCLVNTLVDHCLTSIIVSI